jgi:NADPH-ferrihemoprotein reductase
LAPAATRLRLARLSTAATGPGGAMPPLDKLTVLYGSQTGTAMSFASQLADELSTGAGVSAAAADLYEYAPASLPKEAAAVFVVSCFGRGEPTDSAKKFYAWVMDAARDGEAGGKPLSGLKFAVFGLGSSQTHREYYNVVGKKLDARLEALGGTRVFARGEGDDSQW